MKPLVVRHHWLLVSLLLLNAGTPRHATPPLPSARQASIKAHINGSKISLESRYALNIIYRVLYLIRAVGHGAMVSAEHVSCEPLCRLQPCGCASTRYNAAPSRCSIIALLDHVCEDEALINNEALIYPVPRFLFRKLAPCIMHTHYAPTIVELPHSCCRTGANEALPLFLDKIVPSWLAIILSVTFVLFFGEIIPSSLFTG